MTHGVVQSDIDHAQRLISVNCDEPSAVASLCARGIAEDDARKLLAGLRQGAPVRPELPVRVEARKHHHRRPSRRHDVTTLWDATWGPAVRFQPVHHRRSARRTARRLFRWGTTALACAGILACFAYVGYATWQSSVENRKEMYDRYPLFKERMDSWNKGLPDRGWDDLKSVTPR